MATRTRANAPARQSWYVASSNDYAPAGWLDWPGQVKGKPGTLSHYRRWAEELVFEDGERHPPEGWQLDWVKDLLSHVEAWLVVPEGNSKTTLLAGIALYHMETVLEPWLPLAASTRDQAGILFGQAEGFVNRTPGLKYDRDMNPAGPFVLKGTRHIDHQYNAGKGLQVYAANEGGGDGVIPTLALIDEGHRLKDLGLYRLWKGKLNKRGGRIGLISTAGEPGRDFEKTRTKIKRGAKDVQRRGTCFARYESDGLVLHDYSVPNIKLVEDLEVVKEANPLSTITVRTLGSKRGSDTLDFGEGWLRLTCNIPVVEGGRPPEGLG
jgi:phage terminase large subunit-like protein